MFQGIFKGARSGMPGAGGVKHPKGSERTFNSQEGAEQYVFDAKEDLQSQGYTEKGGWYPSDGVDKFRATYSHPSKPDVSLEYDGKKTVKESGQDSAEPTKSKEPTKEELSALEGYMDEEFQGYKSVNGFLRGKMSEAKATSNLQEAAEEGFGSAEDVGTQVKRLDSLMGKSVLEKDTTVYRGGAAGSFKGLKVGDTISDKGYMSTSASKEYAAGFGLYQSSSGSDHVLEVTLPKGTKALDMTKHGGMAHEAEFLVARGSGLKVVGHRKEKVTVNDEEIEVTVVEAQYMPPVTKSDFQSIFKGARSGMPGAGGVLYPKGPDGTYPVERIKQSFSELSAKGVQIGYTAEDFHDKTQGKVDPVDLVKAIWGKDEYENNQMSDVRITENRGGVNNEHNLGKVSISGAGKLHGADVLLVERNLEHDMSSIEHSYLKLMPGSDGGGAVKKMFASAVPYYKEIGLQGITTHANLEAGGYAWCKYGFTHDDPADYKDGIGKGWSKIVNAANAGIPKEYRKPLSEEAKAEMEVLRDILDKGDDHMGQVLTSVKTTHLDQHFGHTYRTLTPEIPAHVPLNFIKVASYQQHWLGRHSFDDVESTKRLEDYLMPKP